MTKYNLANLFKVFKDKNGNLVFNLNDGVEIVFTDSSTNLYTLHKVKETDTYQTISFTYYGTTRLWWLIAKVNGITDATERPVENSTIKVLNPSFANQVMNALKNVN